MYRLTALLISVLLLGFSATLAQDARSIVQPNIFITGDEVGDPTNNFELFTSDPVSFGPVNSGSLVWTVNNITNRQSGYDLQSNGSTMEIWCDLNNPGYVHAVFTYSSVCDNAWADRTCLYFGTIDNAATPWFELGGVPVNNGTTGRSGFPSIVGTSTGAAVIANHNNADTPTRSTIFIDNTPFEYSFTNYDPGAASALEAIWPILTINDNDDIIMASSENGGDSFYVNTLSSGVYSGWQVLDGDQAETQGLGTSPAGKIGLVYVGAHVGVNDRDILYVESTNAGLSWSDPPVTLFDCDETQFPTIVPGGIRGVSVSFYGEEPCAVFEIGGVNNTQYSNGPSEIYFWSPAINGGTSKVIADTNNVPYYPYLGINDVVWNFSRPVIGRSEAPYNYLFVAFQATTNEYYPGTTADDSTSYFRGMFMYSSDGGDTWSDPEQFTPDSPLLDFRHPSIAPVNPVTVTPGSNDVITVHLAIQGDPMPGSTANGWGIHPPSVTAQYYHITTQFDIVGVDDEIVANNFNLEQNYPNPFNPSTTIKYTLGERSAVTLKVYDVLGNEVANLVNTTQEAGQHSINFDASSLSSGLYIYTLNTGNFTSSKKMMLLK